MTPVRPRVTTVAAPLLLAAAVGFGGAEPAQALASAPVQACTTTSGVLVVVDTGSGPAQTRCAPEDPATGLEALRSAGFEVRTNASGFVCQIDRVPKTCSDTPPMTSFWSYWGAAAGKPWAFATTGAAEHDPAPGTAEGWRLGDGKATPGAASAPALAGAGSASSAPTSTASATASPNHSSPEQGGASTDAAQDGGSPWAIAAVVAALVAAGAALAAALRRRRTSRGL